MAKKHGRKGVTVSEHCSAVCCAFFEYDYILTGFWQNLLGAEKSDGKLAEAMEFDLRKRHCWFFDRICSIPHGSGNEKALSDDLVAFAKARNLRYLQDPLYNVVIYKPASPGYEDHPGLLIQAHMDMVCVKKPGSPHDFEKDPLSLHVEGTHLLADGTSLGADDCMGVAYMLAILEDETLPHPYLECCFTVQEETGLFGAMALKPDYFTARRLINLDGAGEYRTYTTLAGSRNLTIRKAVTMQPVHGSGVRLRVDGLVGGRTGDDIDKERANAGNLMGRLLCGAMERCEVRIAALQLGGAESKPGITTVAEAELVAADAAALRGQLSRLWEEICACYELTEPQMQLQMESCHCQQAMTAAQSKQLAMLLYLLPRGAAARFVHLDGLPYWSHNLGAGKLEDGCFTVRFSGRSPYESCAAQTQRNTQTLCRALDAQVCESDSYYGYRYRSVSPMRDTMDRVFFEQYQQPLAHVAAHGGNECGAFAHMFPDMEIVTTGAIYAKHHTAEEYLDLESFDRSFRFLKALIAAL